MGLSEQDLRALVREAIARRGAGRAAAARPAPGLSTPLAHQHASHALCTVPAGGDDAGACIIEPAVPCTHCGYCKSFGH